MTVNRLVLFVSILLAATTAAIASRAETKRTIFVAALDAKGAAVTDLTAAYLSVKEGGQDRIIASLKESEQPMDLAIVDDDSGNGFFAPAVLQLIQTLQD